MRHRLSATGELELPGAGDVDLDGKLREAFATTAGARHSSLLPYRSINSLNNCGTQPTGSFSSTSLSSIAAALHGGPGGTGGFSVPQRGGRMINRDDWLPMRGEGKQHYALRLMREGHTMPDAFMTCACAQIGQVSC